MSGQRRRAGTTGLLLLLAVFQLVALCTSSAQADIVCPDSSYVVVVFNRTYPVGSQFAGQPYDRITIDPVGTPESFFDLNGLAEPDGLPDIDIRVYIRNCQGQPLVGIPAQDIVLFSNSLCICPGGADSDAGTDGNGCATFTGTLEAGGVAASLDVYADGVFLGTLRDGMNRSVKVNSPDFAHQGITPCYVDAADLAAFASKFGDLAVSNPEMDFNELHETIDLSDLAYFAASLGAACQ